MIVINDLQKEYSAGKGSVPRLVLSVDSFTFLENKRYALMGANGSGKTTFIRLLAQTLEPTKGTISNPLKPQDIGYLPQNPFMFNRSVESNILLGLPKTKENLKRSQEALRAVDMVSFANKRALDLSGGEAQRIALARILMHDYKLVLLDEPTSATDIRGEQIIETALRAYCEQAQCTLIFATHSPAQASRLADYVMVLDEGLIIEVGEGKQVLHNPGNPKVKAFLNYWNLF